MQKRIVRERLEEKLEKLKAERDILRLAASKIQNNMNSIIAEIREIKKDEKKEARKIEVKAFEMTEVSKNAVLNIDPETRLFLEENIYCSTYHNWKPGQGTTPRQYKHNIYMGLVRKWFNKRKNQEELRDVGREIYIINERAKGVTYKELGDNLDISISRVRAIYFDVMKMMKHPKVGRKFIKETKEEEQYE